jgi:hypothetical protein
MFVTRKGQLVPAPVSLDPNDEGDAAGGSTDNFTKEQVQQMLEDQSKKFEAKLTQFNGLLEQEQKARHDLEDVLIEAAGGEEAVKHFMDTGELPEGEGDEGEGEEGEGGYYVLDENDPSLEGIQGAENLEQLIRGMQKRHTRELDAVQRKLEATEEKREALELKRRENKRDQLLSDALVKNDVIDVNAGLKLLRENMEYDGDEDTWRYKTKEGMFMETDAGVAEELPDWLRKPMGGTGGSGARGTGTRVGASRLDALRKEVAVAEKKAQGTGASLDISTWQAKNRELQEAQQNAQAVRQPPTGSS